MSKAYNIATSFLAYQDTFTDYPNQLNIGTANVTTLNADDSITANTATISAVNATNLKMSSTSHEWTIKGIDSAIGDTQAGVSPDTTDADSGQLAIYNGVTKLWGINESGWIQQPNIPAFSAYGRRTADGGAGNGTYAGGSKALFNEAVRYNIGNCYDISTSVFTAPIDGIYFFSVSCFNNSNGTKRVALINSSNDRVLGQGQASGGNDFRISGTTYLYAGDYVYVIISYADTIIYHDVEHNEFNGYLIG